MAIFDIMFIGIMLFAVVVASVFVALVWFGIDDELDTALNDPNATSVIGSVTNAFNVLDYTFLTLAVGLPLVTALLAYFNPIHPILTWFGIFIVAIFMIIFPQLSNFFVTIVTTSDISTTADIENRWPFITFVMQNYPLYMAGSATIIAIALFAKPRDD